MPNPSGRLWPIAVLAGGLATRMRPLTESVPKAMLEVAGRPFIDHQLALLKRKGARRVVLCLGHLGEMIEDQVGDGSSFGLEAVYSHDGPELLGTAGALRKALPLLGENFLALYGDSYLAADYLAVQRAFLESGGPALMTVYHNQGRFDRSNTVFRDGRVLFYSKTGRRPDLRYVDYGLGAFRAETLAESRENDLAGLYARLAAENRLAGFEVLERFYEIGSKQGLAELNAFLANGRDEP